MLLKLYTLLAAVAAAQVHGWLDAHNDSCLSCCVRPQTPCAFLQGLISSDEAAAMLAQPELQASDLLPNKYEGGKNTSSSSAVVGKKPCVNT